MPSLDLESHYVTRRQLRWTLHNPHSARRRGNPPIPVGLQRQQWRVLVANGSGLLRGRCARDHVPWPCSAPTRSALKWRQMSITMRGWPPPPPPSLLILQEGGGNIWAGGPGLVAARPQKGRKATRPASSSSSTTTTTTKRTGQQQDHEKSATLSPRKAISGRGPVCVMAKSTRVARQRGARRLTEARAVRCSADAFRALILPARSLVTNKRITTAATVPFAPPG
ncbi:Hypothetical predicted protein [Olea europaea subsp. europaea]|uniref:Uncharacterized protein n=1 Tax=Olea europaea subsp. europaea TaxID=158383 RepID=A0A8S0V8D8_OLEEU|nr:Hypothetical predicted protein [Olea europaea subsp. europaea]